MDAGSFIRSLEGSIAQYPLAALLVAAAGGVLSTTACPCTLPAGIGLISYVGYQVDSVGEQARRRYGAALALSFFAGLMLSLVVLGTLAALSPAVSSASSIAASSMASGAISPAAAPAASF